MNADKFEAIMARVHQAQADRDGRLVDDIDVHEDALRDAARAQIAVALMEYPLFPGMDHELAAARYRRGLEDALGGAVNVVPAFRAWLVACESNPDELSAEELHLAGKWQQALVKARAAGMHGLADVPASWFDVRLVRHYPTPRQAASTSQLPLL